MSKIVFGVGMVVLCACTVASAEPIKVLYLSKSSGYEHSVVQWTEGAGESYSGRIIKKMGTTVNAEVTETKDASLINADNLANYDVVIFYTSGDLTQEGNDRQPPMSSTGAAELRAWVAQGGGFVAFHAASDSFHGKIAEPTEYTCMLGGEFANHGKQFEGTVRVVDPEHPTMKRFPDGWRQLEEWYVLVNLNVESMHVLGLCEPGGERQRQEMYNVPDYPITWCRAEGEGRVYYTALGHRESVWDNEDFQSSIADAIVWASGEGPADADPNYEQVVPKELPAK